MCRVITDPKNHPNSSDAGRRAVVAVLLPREHLPFIRDWCLHHIEQGWEVVLYDNTGSVGSTRKTSAFSLNRWHGRSEDKRGNSYGAFTRSMSDSEVQVAFRKELHDLPVTIVDWQPRDADGRIVHGQVEAYVDYVSRYRDTVTWAAFIDADEYLQHAPGLDWEVLLAGVTQAGSHRVVLDALVYESRWTRDGQLRDVEELKCLGLQSHGCKNILELSEILRADVHWGWKTSEPDSLVRPDRSLYYFRHYRGSEAALDFTPLPNFGPQVYEEGVDVPAAMDVSQN